MSQMNMQNMLGMTPEQMEIARKTRYAEALRRQSEEPMQGQMVSGYYVAPSWTQGLAKMLSAYGAGKMDRDAADEAKRYGEQQRADFTDTAAKYAQALRGTPEQQTAYEADNPFGEDLGNLQTVTPGQAGDPNKALEIALQSRSPMWQQFAMQAQLKRASQTPRDQFGAVMPHYYTPESLAKFQKSGNYGNLKPATGANFGKYNPGQYTPESWASFVQTGNPADLQARFAPVQIDQGDVKTILEPGSGKTREFDVRLSPDQKPETKAAQTTAVKGAERAVEKQSEAPKARMALNAFESKAKNLESNVDDAINQAGFWTTGFIGSQAQKVPGTRAFDLSKKLESIKANLGFAELQAMRDASPTGGALGSITERELSLLQSAWANVEQAQSKEAFVKALNDVKAINKAALERARAAYNQTYQETPAGNRPPLDSLWD